MTSQRVERTWIRTGGYGRFRGEWVKSGRILDILWAFLIKHYYSTHACRIWDDYSQLSISYPTRTRGILLLNNNDDDDDNDNNSCLLHFCGENGYISQAMANLFEKIIAITRLWHPKKNHNPRYSQNCVPVFMWAGGNTFSTISAASVRAFFSSGQMRGERALAGETTDRCDAGTIVFIAFWKSLAVTSIELTSTNSFLVLL